MEKRFFTEPAIYIDEVSIQVMDLTRSILFYTDMIGFQILSESNQEAVLTADGIRPLLRLVQPEGVLPKEERKAGLYHVAILLPARTDLAAFLAYMLRKKYPLGAADHLVSEALYLNDPDGNGIEVYHDRPSTNWHWNKQQVPYFIQWKNTLAAEDGYCTGLEPSTNYPNAKGYERDHGRVISLPPGQTYRIELDVGVHSSAAEVQKTEQSLVALQKQPPRIHRDRRGAIAVRSAGRWWQQSRAHFSRTERGFFEQQFALGLIFGQ